MTLHLGKDPGGEDRRTVKLQVDYNHTGPLGAWNHPEAMRSPAWTARKSKLLI